MSGPDDTSRGSFFSALRDRTRIVSGELSEQVPRGLRLTAEYAWRFLLIAAAIGVLIWLIIQLKLLVIPMMVAILVTALLWPFFSWMIRHRFPRWIAIVIALLGTFAVVAGLVVDELQEKKDKRARD